MIKKLVYILIFGFLLSTGCKNTAGCVEDAGDIDSSYSRLAAFNKINVYDIFNVYLKKDNDYSIKIITNSNLLKNVEFDVKDSCLEINDNNKCYFFKGYDKKINLYISSPDIKELNFYSASSFYSVDTLKFSRFLFRSYGYLAYADFTAKCSDHLFVSLWNTAGDYYVHGKTEYFQILNHGTSYIHAFDVDSRYCSIEQRSTGDVEVSVTGKLSAIVSDIGNIFYKGSPELDTIIKGKGKIVRVGK